MFSGGMGNMGNMGFGGGKKSKSDNLFSGGMGGFGGGKKGKGGGMGEGFGNFGIPTDFGDKKGKKAGMSSGMDVGFDTGFESFEGIGVGSVDSDSMGGFELPSFEDEPQQQQQYGGFGGYDGSHIHPPSNDNGFMGLNMNDPYGMKPPKKMATQVKQYTHRGKRMVQDPDDPDNLITLATYKKRYGKSTRPERKTRNNIGSRNLGQNMGDIGIAVENMKTSYQVGKNIVTTARKKLKNPMTDMMQPETQPDVDENYDSVGNQDAVRYKVDIFFDDGSSTNFITTSLAEAKSAKSRYDSDPTVTSTQLNYL